MPLFHPRILEKYTRAAKAIPSAHVEILSAWGKNLDGGVFDRETSHDSEFIQRILVDVLGYKGSSSGADCTVGKNQPVGKGNVDTALGFYEKGQFRIVAPFELKGAKTRDLDAIMPGRNKSPVQQAWEYGMDAKGAKWILVSNYREIRLYAIGYGRKDYEPFNLSKLTEVNSYARFMLLLSAPNLLGEQTTNLLEESDNRNQEITNKFYGDYKTLRGRMVDTIVKDNPSVPALEIVEHTQTILDRILFVAFSSDKGLLPKGTLTSCYKDRGKWNPQSAWANFKGLFASIDKGNPPLNIPGYNGGLFAHNSRLDDLEVSDELCKGFMAVGEYDFDSDISVNILGHIFEQSISDLEEIKAAASGDTETSTRKVSKRKKDGIFYTPPYITRYIVEQAVGGWLNDRKREIGFDELPELTDEDYQSVKIVTVRTGRNKSTKVTHNKKIARYVNAWETYKDVLSKIKVLDPACGSGAFLNEVFDYLYREGQIVNGELATLYAGQASLFRWDTHILANNIFGVDINRESVEITKLSLWLKTANRSEKLTYLDDNIKCGNSLIDDPIVAGDHAFSWRKAFSGIISQGGFDVIVGNPPYVFSRENMSDIQKKYFYKNYLLTQFKLNTYVLFIERAYLMLKERGHCGYIVPNNFLTLEYNSDLRRFLLNSTFNIKIGFLDQNVFNSAAVDNVTLVFEKSGNKEITFENLQKSDVRTSSTFDSALFLVKDGCIFSPLSIGASFTNIAERIASASVSLMAIADVKNGVQAYTVGEGTPIQTQQMKQKRVYHDTAKHDATWLKYVDGADVDRYLARWSGQYIKYGSNLSRKRTPNLFVGPRILVRQIPSTPPRCILATYFEDEIVNDNNSMIIQAADTAFDIKFILAVLNSSTVSYWFLNHFGKLQRKVFPQFKVNELRQFPIPRVPKTKQLPLVHRATFIMNKRLELHQLSSKFIELLEADFGLSKSGRKLESWYTLSFSEFRDELEKRKISLTLSQKAEWMEYFKAQKTLASVTKSAIEQADREIDQMAYALYGLTSDEILEIESGTRSA